ncbi:MAG: hypothetical protein LBP29_02355 [Treponema sp.]|jgi:hypothetical protein|nr:hypothetical protein [Treponema sp.]
MANPSLVRTLDYILNHCDEKSIDAVAEAVVRRRRELAITGGRDLPDPRRMARELSSQINTGAGIEGLRETVRDMAVRIIKQQAPELDESQIAELTAAWIPGGGPASDNLPADLLFVMASQFVNFSLGRMPEGEDRRLRSEMGAWPERYWQAFPEVLKLIIKDLVDGNINEEEFAAKLRTALALERA